jgi:hypothetical protein
MGTFCLVYVLFGISSRIWNGLRTCTEVPLYLIKIEHIKQFLPLKSRIYRLNPRCVFMSGISISCHTCMPLSRFLTEPALRICYVFISRHGYLILIPGNNNNSEGRQIDLKSGQWFGATVQSSGEDGVVVVSAVHACY